jgi:hypothetical protein
LPFALDGFFADSRRGWFQRGVDAPQRTRERFQGKRGGRQRGAGVGNCMSLVGLEVDCRMSLLEGVL